MTLIDDGSMPGQWGSLKVDDEGVPTRKNVLIENGVLKSYMVDKLHARITADEAAQLKAHLAADGYDTVQDWLTDVVRGYISKGDRE